MVSWAPIYRRDEIILAKFVHEIGHGGSFESLAALGHGQGNLPLDTHDLTSIISSWRDMVVRNSPCSQPR
jgi:hypothetical protein